MRSTTLRGSLVAQGTALVKEAIKQGRSRCTRGSQSKQVQQLAKDALTRTRSQCVEHICAFVVDIAKRGELVDAEEIGLRLIALAREAHYEGKERPVLSLADLHIAEEEAEENTEVAETVMIHRPSRSAYDAYLRTAALHTSKRRDLDECVRTLQIMATA